jgi:hypothetical protein
MKTKSGMPSAYIAPDKSRVIILMASSKTSGQVQWRNFVAQLFEQGLLNPDAIIEGTYDQVGRGGSLSEWMKMSDGFKKIDKDAQAVNSFPGVHVQATINRIIASVDSEELALLRRSGQLLKIEAKEALSSTLRSFVRAAGLAQLNASFRKPWTALRDADIEIEARETQIKKLLDDVQGKKYSDAQRERVQKLLHKGNEGRKTYTRAQLQQHYSAAEIEMYETIRRAVNLTLDMYRDSILWGLDERLRVLRAAQATAAGPAPAAFQQLAKERQDVEDHYQRLKDEGYFSLKRDGEWVVVARDPAYAPDDRDGLLYTRARSSKEAARIEAQWRSEGYVIEKVERHRKLPDEIIGKFQLDDVEAIFMSRGIDFWTTQLSEVKAIRDAFIERAPIAGYKVRREFIRGYEMSMEAIVRSIVHQAERYASHRYRTVGAGEARKALNATGLQKTDPSLFDFSVRFIEAETIPQPGKGLGRLGPMTRQLTYVMQLAGDVGQLFLNMVIQPLTITYPFFARPEFKLSPLELEQKMFSAVGLAGKATLGQAPQEFQQIYDGLRDANLVGAEFARSLLEGTVKQEKLVKLNHAISVFQRHGERMTRSHCAAMAYSIGKGNLGLSGDNLVRFIADAIDFTQGRFGSGQAPSLARQNEFVKSVYQFSSFTSIWAETLAASVKSEFAANRFYMPSVTRQILTLAMVAGLGGLPGAGLLRLLYYLLTGRDALDDIAKSSTKEEDMQNMAKYGITGLPGAAARMGIMSTDMGLSSDRSDPWRAVPSASTVRDMGVGLWDLVVKGELKGLEGITPRALRGPIKAARYAREGLKTTTSPFPVIPKGRFGQKELIMQSFNITPSVIAKFYEKKKYEKRLK